MHNAKSLVINPASTVSTQADSKELAKSVNCLLLSNLARCNKPRVQAKIDAIGFVAA